MKLPIGRAVSATFAFVLQNWLEILRIVWAPFAIFMTIWLIIGPRYMSLNTEMMLVDPEDTEAVMTIIGQILPLMGLLLLLSFVFYAVLIAGILKLVIRGERPSMPFYLGFGADEWRLLGTWVLLFLIALGIQILAMVAAGVFGAVAAFVPGVGPLLAFAGGLAIFIAFIWGMLRLSLATPAAIGARRIGIGPSWAATKGNVWRLLGFWLVWVVLVLVLQIIAIAVVMPGYFGLMAASTSQDPETARNATIAIAEQANVFAQLSSPLGIVRVLFGLLVGAAMFTFMVAASGVAWRYINGEAGDGAQSSPGSSPTGMVS